MGVAFFLKPETYCYFFPSVPQCLYPLEKLLLRSVPGKPPGGNTSKDAGTLKMKNHNSDALSFLPMENYQAAAKLFSGWLE